MLSNDTTSTSFVSFRTRGLCFWQKNFLRNFRRTVGPLNVIQLHYEYVRVRDFLQSFLIFFKTQLYFTIFCFLFASVYAIIILNFSEFFDFFRLGGSKNGKNGSNRYERGRR